MTGLEKQHLEGVIYSASRPTLHFAQQLPIVWTAARVVSFKSKKCYRFPAEKISNMFSVTLKWKNFLIKNTSMRPKGRNEQGCGEKGEL